LKVDLSRFFDFVLEKESLGWLAGVCACSQPTMSMFFDDRKKVIVAPESVRLRLLVCAPARSSTHRIAEKKSYSSSNRDKCCCVPAETASGCYAPPLSPPDAMNRCGLFVGIADYKIDTNSPILTHMHTLLLNAAVMGAAVMLLR
jgi:hypothetical protein